MCPQGPEVDSAAYMDAGIEQIQGYFSSVSYILEEMFKKPLSQRVLQNNSKDDFFCKIERRQKMAAGFFIFSHHSELRFELKT